VAAAESPGILGSVQSGMGWLSDKLNTLQGIPDMLGEKVSGLSQGLLNFSSKTSGGHSQEMLGGLQGQNSTNLSQALQQERLPADPNNLLALQSLLSNGMNFGQNRLSPNTFDISSLLRGLQ